MARNVLSMRKKECRSIVHRVALHVTMAGVSAVLQIWGIGMRFIVETKEVGDKCNTCTQAGRLI